MTAQILPGNPNAEIESDSLNSALGSGDDIQDACSQVTVPKVFPDDKVMDLKEFIESELVNAGYRVTMYSAARPSASTIEFDYEVEGGSPVEIDKIIESRTNDFVQNGGALGNTEPNLDANELNSSQNITTIEGNFQEVPYSDSDYNVSQFTGVFLDNKSNAKLEELTFWEPTTALGNKLFDDFGNVLYPILLEYAGNFYICREGGDIEELPKDAIEGMLSYADSNLDSSKQEELNCTVENARVEQTEQGTFVVKGDTERFGKDAILYEHYSEEGANKYLDKLKRGGDLAATGYTRSEVDTDSSKKEELNCSEGINAAKLTTEGIAKAMNNSIREDPDTPIVMIPLEGDNVVFISPAGYEDNALVMQGKFPEAAMYVEIFHRDNSATRKKVSGSEVVDFIQNFMTEDLADN